MLGSVKWPTTVGGLGTWPRRRGPVQVLAPVATVGGQRDVGRGSLAMAVVPVAVLVIVTVIGIGAGRSWRRCGRR